MLIAHISQPILPIIYCGQADFASMLEKCYQYDRETVNVNSCMSNHSHIAYQVPNEFLLILCHHFNTPLSEDW